MLRHRHQNDLKTLDIPLIVCKFGAQHRKLSSDCFAHRKESEYFSQVESVCDIHVYEKIRTVQKKNIGDAVNVIHNEEMCFGGMCFVFIYCAQEYKISKIKKCVPNFKVNTSIKHVSTNIYTDIWNIQYPHSLM